MLLLQAFVASEAVCKSEPYVRFLDGRGCLRIGRFVQQVTPKSPRYYTLYPDIDYLKQLLEYANASERRRKVLLRVSSPWQRWRRQTNSLRVREASLQSDSVRPRGNLVLFSSSRCCFRRAQNPSRTADFPEKS